YDARGNVLVPSIGTLCHRDERVGGLIVWRYRVGLHAVGPTSVAAAVDDEMSGWRGRAQHACKAAVDPRGIEVEIGGGFAPHAEAVQRSSVPAGCGTAVPVLVGAVGAEVVVVGIDYRAVRDAVGHPHAIGDAVGVVLVIGDVEEEALGLLDTGREQSLRNRTDRLPGAVPCVDVDAGIRIFLENTHCVRHVSLTGCIRDLRMSRLVCSAAV